MKKKALITYLDNGDFRNVGTNQAMLKKLVAEFEAEGKELNMESHFKFGTISTFTDGSEIILVATSGLENVETIKGMTHVFISKSLINGFSMPDFALQQFSNAKSVQYFELDEGSIKLT